MITNELVQKALGLQEPWYVKDIQMDPKSNDVKVFIDFKRGAKFIDEESGELCGVEKTNERVIKHLFLWQYETYLHIRMPSIKTKSGKVKVIKFPLCDKGSHFTYLFESQALLMSKNMPVYKVGDQLKESDKNIFRIIKKYVDKARKNADYSEVKAGGIDETSSKKGHNYVTSFVDLKNKKICTVVEGKGKETLKEIKQDLEAHNCKTDEINALTMDLSPSFISGAKEYFPNADIIFDKFHVMQLMMKALDEIRKKEAKQNKTLKGSKYLWLNNPDKLKDDKRAKLEILKKENLVLGKAYQIKENLRNFFEIEDYEEAEEYLDLWCDIAMKTNIAPIIKVVKSIKKHKYGIMKYIEKRITNGILEGLNSVIQTIKKVARGFRNMDNFITMIYLKLGNFKVLGPNYLPN